MQSQIFDIPNPWPSAHCSSIAQLSENRFMATWYAGTEEKAKDVCIACSYFTSESGWMTPKVMVKTPNYADGNGILFMDHSGKLWFFWNTIRDEHRSLLRFPWACTDNKYIQSTNFGRTWSEPIPLFSEQIGWNFKNKALYLHNGFILIPMYDEVQARSVIAISENNGKSWSPSQFIETDQDQPGKEKFFAPGAEMEEPLVPIYQNSQPTLFQRKDGAVVALLRTVNLGYIHRSVSMDFGFTWSESEPVSLLNPDAGIDCVKLENGDVVLAFNNSKTSRNPLSLALSRDDGETWEKVKNLEDEQAEFSYPAIVQDTLGSIHVTYTYKRKHIRHVILTEDWFDV